jgi:hypothetical protein
MIPIPFLALITSLAIWIGPIGPETPAREPQLAVHSSLIALTFGAGNSIYFSRSVDGGKSFAPPVRVGSAGILPLTRHRGPRIAFAASAIVITAVVGETLDRGPHAHGLPSDGNLKSWRSTDGGLTWSSGTVINDFAGAASEGLHDLGSDGKTNLFAVWLDKRAGSTRLYGAHSADAGATWSKNVLIYESPDSTICECCRPSIVPGPNSAVSVMFRNWLDGSRDMYLTQSRDSITFSPPQKLGAGTWKLNACPMDGGGLALTPTGVVSAWRRDKSLFLDRPGEKEMKIGEGTDIAISSSRAGVYAIWTSPGGVQVLGPGKRTPDTLDKGSFPSVAALPGGGAVAVWESGGKLAIRAVQ